MKQTVIRQGTARITVKQAVPGLIKPVAGKAFRVSVGVSPIVSTPVLEEAALLKSA